MIAQVTTGADAAWIAFGSAMLGALVGGLASSAGALFTSRRQAAFDARRQIYLDLIPAFTEARTRFVFPTFRRLGDPAPVVVGPKPMTSDEAVEAMVRLAVLAGRKDRSLVAEVAHRWEVRHEDVADDDPRSKPELDKEGKPLPGRREIDRTADESALAHAVSRLEDHLAKKLR